MLYDFKSYFDQLICKNNLTKQKFLWILYDGMAFDEITEIYEKKKNKAGIYKITTDFFRQSGALHEIYLTGKFSRNFLATKTQADNLLYQLNNTNYEMKFYGSEYPLYYLGGGRFENSENYFADNHLGRDIFPFALICPTYASSIFYPITFNYFIENDLNSLDFDKKNMMNALDKNFSSNLRKDNIGLCFESADICCHPERKNLVYYTQIIDAFNHGYSKEHPRTFAASYAVNQAILKIMDWIDDNPDYVLILSSDHGGQAYLGEDNYCNHGCLTPGNEGILVVYMKNFEVLKPKQIDEPEILTTFEVANIISQVIENANIPLESTGKITRIVENGKIIR